MPSWWQILNEIQSWSIDNPNIIDDVRRKYLNLLYQKTQRNIICYYSWRLQKPQSNSIDMSINDDDKNWFMNAVYWLNREQWLDIILHTPWWWVSATESLVKYLRSVFNKEKIRVIVPQIAMSAWTMIACSAKTILLWKQSNLWPTDPQLHWLSAWWVIEWFEKAKNEIDANPAHVPLRQVLISKYSADFIIQCIKAQEQAESIVTSRLEQNMLSNEPNNKKLARDIATYLWNNNEHKEHARHLHYEDCLSAWLKVEKLENDQELQDLVLSVHHAYMITLSGTPTIKIIENHHWVWYFKSLSTQ